MCTIIMVDGIFPEDLVSFGTVKKPEPVAFFDTIPTKFTDPATWTTRTNLRCWNCGLTFDTYPKFIPRWIVGDGITFACDVLGNFHSWPCAVRYALSELPADQHKDTLDAIALVESKFSGQPKLFIQPALPKTVMKAYTGPGGITAEEYLESIESTQKYGFARR
jgi:hypothetical protein